MGLKVVIIGAVAAGPKAACHIMRLLPDAEITMVDEDSLISYGGCGIPYFVAGDVADEKELRSTSFHMVRDIDFFEKAKGIKTMTETRALAIDRKNKTVHVKSLKTGEESDLPYDKLLISTGTKPFKLPIPGIDAENVFAISTLTSGINVKDLLIANKVGSAVVIGGGAIGVEMAEAFSDLWGVETTLIEFAPHLFPGAVDEPCGNIMADCLRRNGVDVYVNEGAQEIICKDGKAVAVKTNNREIPCDLVIAATGVRVRNELAVAAGLQVGMRGGITVNSRMQTSDPNIYAAGDCSEIVHMVSGERMTIPLGSLANREGRVAGTNIAGGNAQFKGAVGSFIVKAYDTAMGSAGLTMRAARMAGFDPACVWISTGDRAHFFPTHAALYLCLVYDKRTRRVLGIQGTGPGDSDSLSVRIDTAMAFMTQGGVGDGAKVEDLCNAETAYAPPFSSAIDALNNLAFAAENQMDGYVTMMDPMEFIKIAEDGFSDPDTVIVDVRTWVEVEPFVEKYGKDKWIYFPYATARENSLDILPKDKTILLFCSSGGRAYEVNRVLTHAGYDKIRFVPGGHAFMSKLSKKWLPESQQ